MTALPGETYRLAFPSLPNIENPAYISYGRPCDEACSHHVKNTFDSKRAYIIASASLSKNTDAVEKLKSALGDRFAGIRVGIGSHTPWDEVVDITKDALEKKADCLITIGGGSLVDGGKAILLCMANNITTLSAALDLGRKLELPSRDAREVMSRSSSQIPCIAPKIPLICIPTTLSGGEYTKFSGITDPHTHHKMLLGHPWSRPRLIINDPQLTLTAPERVWLSTGVRGIDHCVEAYCRLRQPDEELDAAALYGFQAIVPSLLITKQDFLNQAARLNCMLGVNAVTMLLEKGASPGASHGIGHQLGPLGVPHGETSCILLPSVMKWNKKANFEKQERIRQVMWEEATVAEVLKRRGLKEESSDVGDALDAVFRELGMPRTLKEKGIEKDKFNVLAENSLKDASCSSNPIPLETKEQVIEILEMCAG